MRIYSTVGISPQGGSDKAKSQPLIGTGWPYERQIYLQKCDPDKGASNNNEVVLQPFFKLPHTAFGIDVFLLIQLLYKAQWKNNY